MTVLILNNSPAKMYNYKNWLSDLNEDIIILTDSKYYQDFIEQGYTSVFSFENYTSNGCVELKAFNLAQHHKISNIIATNEFDLIRASKLRKILGIQGQSLESALAYRNKSIMKDILANSGISVPKFIKVDDALDIINFIKNNGYPVVVKPVNGAASVDTHIIRSEIELKILLEKGINSNMEVEEYINGDMYHVDGVLVDNHIVFIWPSKYLTDPLGGYQSNNLVASQILEKHNSLTNRLIKFASDVINTLPTPLNCAFHAEVFHTENDELVLCEIASRVGGAKIPEVINHAFDINLREIMVKSQCGLINSKQLLSLQQKEYNNILGWVFFPPKKGKLINMETDIFPDWVIEKNIKAEIGKLYDNPSSNIDHIASFIVDGTKEEIVAQRIIELSELFYNKMKWEM